MLVWSHSKNEREEQDISEIERSVTVKFQGKDAPWFVYKGSTQAIRTAVIEDFDLDPVQQEGVPLAGIVNNAQRVAETLSKASGTVLASITVEGTPSAEPAPTPQVQRDEAQQTSSQGEDPWAEDDTPSDPLAPLYAAVEEAASVDELKTLWADNKEAFTGPLLDAYKAKGKSLKAAA